MTPKKFLALIEKQQPELLKLVRDDLPRIVGTKAMQHFRENFARGGFVDRDLEPWEITWRQKTLSGADGQRGPLLSRTNTLCNRIYFRASAPRLISSIASGVGGKDGVGGTRFDADAASRAAGSVNTRGRNGDARAFGEMKSYG